MTDTLKDLMNRSFEAHAERLAIRTLKAGRGGREGEKLSYQPMTYGDLKMQRDAVAAGLNALGLRSGQRVGVLTESSVEPLLLFLACDLLGLSTVPLCSRASAEMLIHYIDHSRIEVLVLDCKALETVRQLSSSLRREPRFVVTDGEVEGLDSWHRLTDTADASPLPHVDVNPGQESKLLYTSGSSGLPKGVVQSHANIVANLLSVWDLISTDDEFRFFKSAPDYHSMGILNIYLPLVKGWSLDLARSPDRVLSDIRHSEPEGFLTVPLVLDKVYGNVRREIDAGGIKGRLVKRAVASKQRHARGTSTFSDRVLLQAIGRRVIGKIREQLARRVGAHLKVLIVGSAKADPAALDFFQEVLDITTFEGYGTTECAPLIAANHLRGRKTGTVGRPLFEVKLVDETGGEVAYGDPQTGVYRASWQTGELWVSGANVMSGYLDDVEQSSLVLIEEGGGKIWYRTGDLFNMDGEGFLTFRGRIGRQFKLANGEFVNPEQLERVFSRVTLIEHVIVAPHEESDTPVVLVTVNVEEAAKLDLVDDGESSGDDEEALRSDPRLGQHIRMLLLREADAAGLPLHERPTKVVILPEALSEDTGTLTRGLRKIVPGLVVERYRELVDACARGG